MKFWGRRIRFETHADLRLDPPAVNSKSPSDCFQSTRWTIVAKVKDGADSKSREAALESLCRQYWKPLYVYVVKHGHPPEDAKDIVQDFFASILKKDLFADADPSRGKLRSFLIHALKCELSDVHRSQSTQKRGGHVNWIRLEASLVEIADSSRTPEEDFERQWAEVLVDACLTRLQDDYAKRGQSEVFHLLRPALLPGSGESMSTIAAQLGKSEGTTRVALTRMRKKFGEILLDEVSATLLPGDDPKEEVRHLMRALSPSS